MSVFIIFFTPKFENIKEMETRVKAQAQFRDAENWFEERLQFFETEMKKGTITHVQGFFVKLLQDNYINPEIEKQKKIELIKQKNKEIAQKKANLEAELKAIGDAVWSEKMSIATNLLKQNEALLDEITGGNGSLLFKGNFDKTLSYSDNLLKATMPICVWVISKIEESTPQYFEHLAIAKKKMTVLRDMIAKT